MNVGMGGTDVSLGTIAQSIAGLDAWRVNAELWTSKELEAHKYASALRTLYSVGGAAEKALYEELLSGKTNIEVNRDGAYSAKTEANGDGTKTIYIGSEALAKGSRFGMNILLAHEAYRNGIDDGEAGQREETDRAVLGHIGAAYALGQNYGMGAIGEALGKEVATYLAALSTGNMGGLARLLASYDASGDYWKLLKDGTLIFDGRRELYITYIDETGKEVEKMVEGSGETGSMAASLVQYLGQERAEELLNRVKGKIFPWDNKIADISTYDDKTLRDVLNLTQDEVLALRANKLLWKSKYSTLTAIEKQKLIGEALMKSQGMSDDNPSQKWQGNCAFRLSDSTFNDYSIGVTRGEQGSYDWFTVEAYEIRKPDAYKVAGTNDKGEWTEYYPKYADNTDLIFIKRDLNGKILDKYIVPFTMNHVDTAGDTKYWDKRFTTYDVRYHNYSLGDIQGNTIMTDYDMRIIPYPPKVFGVNKVFLMSNARIASGETIGIDGRRLGYPNDARWLGHPSSLKILEGCLGFGPSAVGGKYDEAKENFLAVLNKLQREWGVSMYQQIHVNLTDWYYGAWPGYGRR